MTDQEVTLKLMRTMTSLMTAGVRYAYQGRTPVDGLDCHGLLLHLYASCGIVLPDLVIDEQDKAGSSDVADVALLGYQSEFVELSRGMALRPLDVLFVGKWQSVDNHVGVCLDPHQVAHSSEHLGISVSPVSTFSRIRASRWFRHMSR